MKLPIFALSILALCPVARPQATRPADIAPPPASLNLDPFYRKYLDAGGIPIVSSEKVNDYALREAAYLVNQVLAKSPSVRKALVEAKLRIVVMAYNEYTTDVPEHKDLKPARFWNKRARGLGASRDCPVVSCGEENLLCYPGDPYRTENILIHEFGHAILSLGLRPVDKTYEPRLREVYRRALEAGRWKGTYAAENPHEFFAEAVQSWFDTNRPKDAIHNGVDTREKVQAFEPELARLMAEAFGDNPWRYSRPDRRTEPGHLSGYDRSAAPRFAWPADLVDADR